MIPVHHWSLIRAALKLCINFYRTSRSAGGRSIGIDLAAAISYYISVRAQFR